VYCMERSINFLVLREQKVAFFCDLKKQVEDCMKVSITLDDLQRIMFLAPGFYNLNWEKHNQFKKYDLVLRKSCIEDNTEDKRKVSFRRAIVDYLSRLHEEFLSQPLVIMPLPAHKWHPGFNL
jgi:hypothetical protein